MKHILADLSRGMFWGKQLAFFWGSCSKRVRSLLVMAFQCHYEQERIDGGKLGLFSVSVEICQGSVINHYRQKCWNCPVSDIWGLIYKTEFQFVTWTFSEFLADISLERYKLHLHKCMWCCPCIPSNGHANIQAQLCSANQEVDKRGVSSERKICHVWVLYGWSAANRGGTLKKKKKVLFGRKSSDI